MGTRRAGEGEALDALASPAPVPLQGRTPTPAAGEPEASREGLETGTPGSREDGSRDSGSALRGEAVDVWITFYACYGANGGYCADPAGPEPLAEGQAACGAAWPMGTVLLIEGDPLGPVVCNDLGHLGFYHVDRFFWYESDGWAWLAEVGDRGTVILR